MFFFFVVIEWGLKQVVFPNQYQEKATTLAFVIRFTPFPILGKEGNPQQKKKKNSIALFA